jgi:hypothetical protein
MKIGVTKLDDKERRKENGEQYKYTVWFRTSDGELHSRLVTPSCRFGRIITEIKNEESEVQFDETGKETKRETFLNEI